MGRSAKFQYKHVWLCPDCDLVTDKAYCPDCHKDLDFDKDSKNFRKNI